MNFKPIYDRVVVDPNMEENISKAGIVLPQTSQERPQIGVVVAVGDGENFDGVETKMKVKIGDKILFQKYAGNELKMENKTYIVLRQIDVIGVFNDWEKNCHWRTSKSGVVERCWNSCKCC